MSLFINDNLVFEFENFINQIFKRNSKNTVLNHYETIDSRGSGDSTVVLTLKIKNKIALERDGHLPEILKCRESFLNRD